MELVDTDLYVFLLLSLWADIKGYLGLVTQIFAVFICHVMLQCVDKH